MADIEGVRHVQVRMDPDSFRALKVAVAAEGASIQQIVESSLKAYLLRQGSSVLAAAEYGDDRLSSYAQFLATAPVQAREAVGAMIDAWLAMQLKKSKH